VGQKPRELSPGASMRDFFGAELRRWREMRGISQAVLANLLHVSSSTIGKAEAASRSLPRGLAARCDQLLQTEGALQRIEAMVLEEDRDRRTERQGVKDRHWTAQTVETPPSAHLELLRQRVEDGLSSSVVGATQLVVWQRVVAEHAASTRHISPSELVEILAADTAELERLLGLRHSASTLRELTRLAAQMSGLLSLTLLKTNDRVASRQWARTARRAAEEARDPAVVAWVRAQEAHTAFYAGNTADAALIARYGQEGAASTPSVGRALAAALEARALAIQGRAYDAQAAIALAEQTLAALPADQAIRSALGYDEAQLRFHEGNVYTHLGLTELAWIAQRRALALYPDEDYLDRALIHLDRAACLVHQGEIEAAIDVALAGITGLRLDQRRGMVAARTAEVIGMLPENRRTPGSVRNLRELLRQDEGRT